jgi:CDP-diacylglycerol--serine O-phosphatidyltransferase
MTESNSSRKGIYLLPNLLTTGSLFAGFYAIVSANLGRFEQAAIAIFIAMVLDGLDGRVARMTNSASHFGEQYDSLADMVSFGLAPALIIFEWSLQNVSYVGWIWVKVGWLAAFFYTAAAALRLARFNSLIADQDKRYFQGLPSPAAAGVLLGLVWVSHDLNYSGAELWVVALIITLLTGGLMVSNFSYYSFKEFRLLNKVPFIAMLAIVGVFILASIDPPKFMFAVFFVFALSGPITHLVRWQRKRVRGLKKSGKASE